MKKILLAILLSFGFSGCFLDHTTGVQVAQSSIEQIVPNKSTKNDVEQIIGYPSSKNQLGDSEIWYYDYQKIAASPFASNVDERTVVEFDKKGKVTKIYKTKGAGKNPFTGN